MENGIYIGLSRQIVLQRQMNLLANNIANINTPGYKAQKPIFEEYLSKPEKTREEMSLVFDYGQFHVEAQGPMKLTGNPLDVALDGPGWMMVATPEGTQYTRAGNFAMNAEGELVTPTGLQVLDDGQKPITLPDGATDIRITTDGQVTTSEGVAGRIGVVEFDNQQMLAPSGNGLYTVRDEVAGQIVPQPAENTLVRQNMIEGSNVQGVLEMTDMIDVSRTYQSISRMLQSEHDRQRSAIQQLTEA